MAGFFIGGGGRGFRRILTACGVWGVDFGCTGVEWAAMWEFRRGLLGGVVAAVCVLNAALLSCACADVEYGTAVLLSVAQPGV